MNITYTHESGSQVERPSELDMTSSKNTVYLRKNIERVSQEDPITGETLEFWEYDEARLSHVDYAIYAAEKSAEDLIEAEQEITDQDLALMEAEQEITDLDLRVMELENEKEG